MIYFLCFDIDSYCTLTEQTRGNLLPPPRLWLTADWHRQISTRRVKISLETRAGPRQWISTWQPADRCLGLMALGLKDAIAILIPWNWRLLLTSCTAHLICEQQLKKTLEKQVLILEMSHRSQLGPSRNKPQGWLHFLNHWQYDLLVCIRLLHHMYCTTQAQWAPFQLKRLEKAIKSLARDLKLLRGSRETDGPQEMSPAVCLSRRPTHESKPQRSEHT